MCGGSFGILGHIVVSYFPQKKTNGEVRGKRKTTVADIPFLLPHELFHELIQAGQTQV